MTLPEKTKIQRDLDKILEALDAAGGIYCSKSIEDMRVNKKSSGDFVTDAELEVNRTLFKILVGDGDGWLSEEDSDTDRRLRCSRIWFVDPLDGTKEYVGRIPEWCVSIALMQDGKFVAAGILNPETDELIYGSCEIGVIYRNARSDGAATKAMSREPLVLASRSEMKRGEWERFSRAPLRIQAIGSVAYKLALVAAGEADATWTLVPKNEWDVAAGVALLQFSKGYLVTTEGRPPAFNQVPPLFPGLVGVSAAGRERLRPFLKDLLEDPEFRDCVPWTRPLLASDAPNAIGLSSHEARV